MGKLKKWLSVLLITCLVFTNSFVFAQSEQTEEMKVEQLNNLPEEINNFTGSLRQYDLQGNLHNLANVSLYLYDEERIGYRVDTNDNGIFESSLTSGTYKIERILKDGKHLPLNYKEQIIINDSSTTYHDIKLPAVNVDGSIYDIEDTWTYGNASIRVYKLEENGSNTPYELFVDESGKIEGSLPVGNYEVRSIRMDNTGKYVEFERTPFVVVAGEMNHLSLLLPTKTIQGIVVFQDELDLTTGSVSIVISQTIGNNETGYRTQRFHLPVNSEGYYEGYLPAGNYKLDHVTFYNNANRSSKIYNIDKQDITLTNDNILTKDVLVKASNVQGVFKDGDTVLDHATLFIRLVDNNDYTTRYEVSTDANGTFSTYLPIGEYSIDRIIRNNQPIDIREMFTITEGMNHLTISLNPIIRGTMRTENGMPLHNYSITVLDKNGDNGYSALVSNGNFELRLPDGDYMIRGYRNPITNIWTSFPLDFSVVNGEATPTLDLIVHNSNVKGKVMLGDSILIGAQVNISDRYGNHDLYTTYTNDRGEYELYLPAGSYMFNGVWTTGYEYWKPADIAFTVVEGQSHDVSVVLEEDNVNGVLQGAKRGWLSARNITTGEWHSFPTNENGEFTTSLPDGDYRIISYYENGTGKSTQVYYEFNIKDKVSSPALLSFSIPAITAKAKVLDKDGQPVKNEWINFRDEAGARFSQDTDENGVLEIRLPAGNYVLEGYYDNSKDEWTILNNKFTIVENVVGDFEFKVPEANLKGNLRDSKGPISRVWLKLTNKNGHVETVQTREDGTFEVWLNAGEYVIEGFFDEHSDSWVLLNTTIEVSESDVTTVNLLASTFTLTGTLVDEYGNGVASAIIGIQDKNISGNKTIPVRTSKDGSFQAALAPGKYQIVGYQVSGSEKFTIIKGEEFEISQDGITQITVNKFDEKVVGNITLNDVVLSNVWVAFKDSNDQTVMAYADENGNYAARMPNGKYTLVGVYLGNNEWHIINEEMDISGEKQIKNITIVKGEGAN